MIVYISIDNSDDKLSQKKWSNFWKVIDQLVRTGVDEIHGCWLSEPSSEFQNACWCVEFNSHRAGILKNMLSTYARQYNQDSIAWAEAENTEFI